MFVCNPSSVDVVVVVAACVLHSFLSFAENSNVIFIFLEIRNSHPLEVGSA